MISRFCPPCTAELALQDLHAETCWNCDASFAIDSKFQPTEAVVGNALPRPKSKEQHYMGWDDTSPNSLQIALSRGEPPRVRRTVHAAAQFLVFVVLGPPLGLLAISLWGTRASFDALVYSSFLPFAFAFGLIPAALAAMIFLLMQNAFERFVVGRLPRIAAGTAAGIGAGFFFPFLFVTLTPDRTRVDDHAFVMWLLPCIPAATVCALFASVLRNR